MTPLSYYQASSAAFPICLLSSSLLLPLHLECLQIENAQTSTDDYGNIGEIISQTNKQRRQKQTNKYNGKNSAKCFIRENWGLFVEDVILGVMIYFKGISRLFSCESFTFSHNQSSPDLRRQLSIRTPFLSLNSSLIDKVATNRSEMWFLTPPKKRGEIKKAG